MQKILDVSDKLSYDIYLTHMIYVKGILSIIGKTGSYFCDILIILAVCILSGCCLHILCHVCIPKVCRALRFGRYYGVK